MLATTLSDRLPRNIMTAVETDNDYSLYDDQHGEYQFGVDTDMR
jgi:hypothetical protein